nr:glycosyltransferase family 4 protein [Actinopolymorpha rutila]
MRGLGHVANASRRPTVLFLTQFFPPETFAGANRAHALAGALAETHALTVVALYPGYPNQNCFEAEAVAGFDSMVPFSIRRRFRFSPHRHRSALGRAAREQWVAFVLALRGLGVRADVVVTSSPTMFLGPVGLVAARMKRAAFVWDVRDITWAMTGEMTGGNRFLRLLASALCSAMWATARRCDLLVAATPGIARMALEAGVAADRIVTVENGITEPLRVALAGSRSRSQRARPVVSYVGLLGKAQELSTLVEAAQRLPDVDFVIAGDGPQRSRLQQQVRRSGCDNVRLVGYVRPAQLPGLFGDSDLLFAQVADSSTLNRTARPSKLLEYMAAGRPIVYAGGGDAATLVTEVGCGVCTAPGDPEGIAATIRQLLDDDQRRGELGRRGATYVDGLPSRDERMRGLARIVQQRFSTSGRPR